LLKQISEAFRYQERNFAFDKTGRQMTREILMSDGETYAAFKRELLDLVCSTCLGRDVSDAAPKPEMIQHSCIIHILLVIKPLYIPKLPPE
jgi:hypothetical protein